ncbi:aminoglycoside phosphotransferase family protein [Roseospira visakhapatnamensis]|uniref:Aminoglycoside phosphotransferase domain-containing protein n=1 Tax=Roseospira visakhapatnamensis TaxID=390880 RepID=A0A7W6RA54_9PROT|nr:phosphotransferase [Roseospira visakhapatnamensis]MBB4264713.1 hypothetical protein [Roseospira visakhapatnamensis]
MWHDRPAWAFRSVDSTRQAALAALLTDAGWTLEDCRPLAGDASFRTYHRLVRDDRRAILMDAPPAHEDAGAFVRIAHHLVALGYSAPRILAESASQGFVLLEDLGDETFTRCLSGGANETALYAMAVDLLIDLHRRPPDEILPPDLVPRYDDTRLIEEVCLLTNWYVPAVLGTPPVAGALFEYEALWRAVFPLARAVPETLVLRDFHMDNLMRLQGRRGVAACGLLDFQDAVAGPVTYDLVSLLEDARRDIDPALVAVLRHRYRAAFPALDADAFAASWAVMAAQRHAKVIGIFTRLHRRDGKSDYLPHIARVWRLLEAALTHPMLADLRTWFEVHVPPWRRITPT